MSKSIHLYIDDGTEEIINIILNNTDEFESEASCIRLSVKRYLKGRFPELLLEKLEDEKER